MNLNTFDASSSRGDLKKDLRRIVRATRARWTCPGTTNMGSGMIAKFIAIALALIVALLGYIVWDHQREKTELKRRQQAIFNNSLRDTS